MAPTRGGLVSLFAVISTEVEKSLIIPVALSGRNSERCLDSARHDKMESDKAHVPPLQALVPEQCAAAAPRQGPILVTFTATMDLEEAPDQRSSSVVNCALLLAPA